MAKRKATKATPKKETKRSAEDWAPKLLEVLAHTGNISHSCALAGTSRDAFYDRRNSDDEFAKKVKTALSIACDALELEARRRAHDGVEKPVFYKGDICGHVKEYSDTLIIFLLKAHRPKKFRETHRHEMSGPGGKPIQYDDITDEKRIPRLLALYDKWRVAQAGADAAGVGAVPEQSAVEGLPKPG